MNDKLLNKVPIKDDSYIIIVNVFLALIYYVDYIR